MPEAPTAAAFLPQGINLTSLRKAARRCQGCHLFARGSQTVSGEGFKRSRPMLVGEQPGDREDREGRLFVEDLRRVAGWLDGKGSPA